MIYNSFSKNNFERRQINRAYYSLNMEMLDWFRFFLGACMLCYGSWTDFKTRRVPNQNWLIFGTLASILLIYEFYTFWMLESI